MHIPPSRGLWLHGFMGHGAEGDALFADWKPHGVDVLCPTLPGHGFPAQPARSLTATLDWIAALAAERDWAAGYSMGGRLLMMAAARHPEAFSTLILESASPGYAHPAERKTRRGVDQQRAERLRQEGLEAFTAWWYTLPLWKNASPPPPRPGDPDALAHALTTFSSGNQPDMRTWLRSTPCRILWLAGAEDSAYAERAKEIEQIAPRVYVQIIPDAAHNVHRDQTKPWRASLQHFLNPSSPKEQ